MTRRGRGDFEGKQSTNKADSEEERQGGLCGGKASQRLARSKPVQALRGNEGVSEFVTQLLKSFASAHVAQGKRINGRRNQNLSNSSSLEKVLGEQS